MSESQTKRTVILVDDEKLVMDLYVKALSRNGFSVQRFRTTDESLTFVSHPNTEADILIIDMMMPPGTVYKNQKTGNGMESGVLLYTDMRQRFPATPIILLTNVNSYDTLRKLPEDPLLQLVHKSDCPPMELVDLVNSIVAKARAKSPKQTTK